MKDKETTMGQLLIESLTTDQIACMLEAVASAGHLESLMDDFMKADPDMAATVDEILKRGADRGQRENEKPAGFA